MSSEQECLAQVFKELMRFRKGFSSNAAMASRLRISTGTVTKWMSDRNEYRGERTMLRSGTLRKFVQYGDDGVRKRASALLGIRTVGHVPAPRAQLVRWGPSDGLPAGIKLTEKGRPREIFIAWSELKDELCSRLLPQLLASPEGFTFITAEHYGKQDWLVYLVNAKNQNVCFVWLGVNPAEGWKWDGLIRVGHLERAEVWQVYHRYSDGSYRRLKSQYRTLEQAIEFSSARSQHLAAQKTGCGGDPRTEEHRKKETVTT